MIRTITFILFSVILTGCAAFGTKTLYKSNTKPTLTRVGFAKLDGDTIVSKLFPQTDYIFRKTFIETFQNYNVADVVPINNEFSINKPDTSAIRKICIENNLDGFIVSKIKFIHMTYTMNFIPIAKNWDTEVEMRLFNNTGNLTLSVLHNTTKGNSYFMPPTADRTIHDGTEGAVKRIAKELTLTR